MNSARSTSGTRMPELDQLGKMSYRVLVDDNFHYADWTSFILCKNKELPLLLGQLLKLPN